MFWVGVGNDDVDDAEKQVAPAEAINLGGDDMVARWQWQETWLDGERINLCDTEICN